MPTYQYACTACGHQLEAVQSFSDEPLTECPACEGRLRKLFNSVGIVFKGSGFYRTDSRSSGSDNATSTASKPAKAESSSNGSSNSSTGSSNGSSASTNGGSTKAPAASAAS
ncbi:putative regulatory protein, FmdB family [Micromonospora rhizosphaerae]|uniref:Putative regulatory protein, FmdB family n=1 Tax=Micromonospora rhizosphaerae TaxID=568872 RepID=A0A1C6RMQ1_9ACTN|nr:putative regulatory protein, FmdB family [Micromonospora rhizosphaerae]